MISNFDYWHTRVGAKFSICFYLLLHILVFKQTAIIIEKFYNVSILQILWNRDIIEKQIFCL